jgi:hypothetical protein
VSLSSIWSLRDIWIPVVAAAIAWIHGRFGGTTKVESDAQAKVDMAEKQADKGDSTGLDTLP